MKFGTTNIAYGINTHSADPNNPTRYTIDDLIGLSRNSILDGQTPVEFDITKFHKSASGDIQTVNGAGTGHMSFFPEGYLYRDQKGTKVVLYGYATEDAVLPGNDAIATVTDTFGQPETNGAGQEKKDAFTGIKERSVVLVCFDEGNQDGYIVLTITDEWGVMFAPVEENRPFQNVSNDTVSLWSFLLRMLPPVPIAMVGTVDDADLS